MTGEVITLRSGVIEVSLLPLGAAIHRVRVPDRHGRTGDVHLFLPKPGDYLDRSRNPHLGASIGRYANRIAGARFPLDGRVVELAANDGPNTLHGGPAGFDRHEWTVVTDASLADGPDGGAVTFALRSPDGDQGFPGAADVTATYELDGPRLSITYTASTDAPTVVNLTNHGYWNLASGGLVGEHLLTVAARRYLPVGADGIPTDAGLIEVTGSPFDLREPRRVADVVRAVPGGLDHCFEVAALGAVPIDELAFAARLDDPGSGRWLTVHTDRPGVQVYTGNHLHPPFRVHGSISLETQRFPDTPNRPELGSARLAPGDHDVATTVLTFGTDA